MKTLATASTRGARPRFRDVRRNHHPGGRRCRRRLRNRAKILMPMRRKSRTDSSRTCSHTRSARRPPSVRRVERPLPDGQCAGRDVHDRCQYAGLARHRKGVGCLEALGGIPICSRCPLSRLARKCRVPDERRNACRPTHILRALSLGSLSQLSRQPRSRIRVMASRGFHRWLCASTSGLRSHHCNGWGGVDCGKAGWSGAVGVASRIFEHDGRSAPIWACRALSCRLQKRALFFPSPSLLLHFSLTGKFRQSLRQ